MPPQFKIASAAPVKKCKKFGRQIIQNFFLSQIENLEELLKEKDNQVEMARSKLSAVQAQTFTSEGALTSLEEALR